MSEIRVGTAGWTDRSLIRNRTWMTEDNRHVFNNCYRDWAHVNAGRLSELLAAPAPGA